MTEIKQPGRRCVKESDGENPTKCEARGKGKALAGGGEAEETRLILQLVPFFVRLLDDGQLGMWIRNRKSAVRRVACAMQHQRPFFYESRLRSLGIEAYL